VRASIRTWPILAIALASGAGCSRALFLPYGPEALSEGAIRLQVPFVPQEHARGCGWSVASMLFRYYDHPISDEDRELLKRNPESDVGVTGRALRELLARNGFRAAIFEGAPLDETGPRGVLYHLSRGWPLVVMISPHGVNRHYVIVSGIDERRGLVVMVEPVRGEVVCERQDFNNLWERGNYFALLAVPERLGGREGGQDSE